MTDKKQEKIKILGTTESEKAIRKKWLIYGGGAMLLVFIVSVFMASDGKKQVKKILEPSFVDMTPNITSSEQLTLSKMQEEIKRSQLKIEEQERLHKLELQRLQSSIEDEKLSDQQRLEELEERLKREREESEERIKLAAKKASEEAAKRQASSDATSEGLPSYIRPPRVDGSSSAPPPPALARNKEEEGRSNLPSRTGQQSSGLGGFGQPIIIRHGDDAEGSGIIHGFQPEEEKWGAEDQLSGFLPVGSFAEVAIITGADFPAGSGSRSNPLPTLMRIQTDAILPGKARYKLRDCFAIGSGHGDLSSERAYIQISRISCINDTTGQTMEAQLLGYLADSDGKQGMRGVVERRNGMILGKALLAGFAEGAAKILSVSATDMTSTITGGGVVSSMSDAGNIGKAGAYGGAGRAAEILADHYIKEAESIFPVIEVDAGRKATIVVQIGQNLKWMPLGEEN